MARRPVARRLAREAILQALSSERHHPLTMEVLQRKCEQVSYWTIKRAVSELVEDGVIRIEHLPSDGGRPKEAYFPTVNKLR